MNTSAQSILGEVGREHPADLAGMDTEMGEQQRVRMESQFIDAGPWDAAVVRFKSFRREITLLALESPFDSQVETAEAFIDSPEGRAPVTVLVRLILAGPSWAQVRRTADSLVAEAALRAGITISDGEEVGGPEPGVYQEGDLELASA